MDFKCVQTMFLLVLLRNKHLIKIYWAALLPSLYLSARNTSKCRRAIVAWSCKKGDGKPRITMPQRGGSRERVRDTIKEKAGVRTHGCKSR